jgi:predicted ATPase
VLFKGDGDPYYQLILAPTKDDGLFCWHEEINSDIVTTLVDVQDREAGISKPGNRPYAGWVHEHLNAWQRYHLSDTSYMCKTAAVRDNDFLRANGSNLPAFLYYLQNRWGSCYALIVHAVRQVAPFFDDFVLNPDRNNPDVIQLVWRHKGSDQYYFASSLSDGTLRFIAIATLLLQPPEHRRSLLLIDEPELGLHPYAIGLLAALIKQAAVDTQLIVSTQSSALLDDFQPEDVLVAERVEGGTQFTRQDPDRG